MSLSLQDCDIDTSNAGKHPESCFLKHLLGQMSDRHPDPQSDELLPVCFRDSRQV